MDINSAEMDTERAPLLPPEPGPPETEPTQPKQGNFRLVTACILFMELCERLTFYSITSNMVIFGTNKLGYTTGEAVNVNFIFTGKKCYQRQKFNMFKRFI